MTKNDGREVQRKLRVLQHAERTGQVGRGWNRNGGRIHAAATAARGQCECKNNRCADCYFAINPRCSYIRNTVMNV
jgi:hypothetical protein